MENDVSQGCKVSPPISRQQTAILQAMGTDVYRLYRKDAEQAPITKKAWFSSLLSLLSISEEDCQFSDKLPISFDPINKKLVLPLSLGAEDAQVKREIWQHIKQHVDSAQA